MKSFFLTVEMEMLRRQRFNTKAEDTQEVFIFMIAKRIRLAQGGRSPTEFEAAGRS